MHHLNRVLVRYAPVLLLLLLAMPLKLNAQETQDTTKLEARLRAARAEISAAYSALDAARTVGHYADSAVVEFQGEVFNGKPAIQAWLTDALAGLSALRFGPANFTIAPTEVVERTAYTVVLPDGTQQQGSSTATWRKQRDGSWKVVRLVVA